MVYPRDWARLPGPADFLGAIIGDLMAGNSVILSVPCDVPSALLSLEVARRIRGRRLWEWKSFSGTKGDGQDLEDFEMWRSSSSDVDQVVVWVDARKDDWLAEVWGNRLIDGVGSRDSLPRICLAMNLDAVKKFHEEKGLRIRRWARYVSDLDSRVLVARRERKTEASREYVSLKSALVGEIAGSELSVTEELVHLSIEDLLDVERFSVERIWAAQISVLFPLLDRERRRILEKYREYWRVPFQSRAGREIRNYVDLEIADMADQAKGMRGMRREIRNLYWLRRVRNALAHMKVVPWSTLVSTDGASWIKFR